MEGPEDIYSYNKYVIAESWKKYMAVEVLRCRHGSGSFLGFFNWCNKAYCCAKCHNFCEAHDFEDNESILGVWLVCKEVKDWTLEKWGKCGNVFFFNFN